MSIVNKLGIPGSNSVARLTQIPCTGNVVSSSLRQAVATVGKAVPAKQMALVCVANNSELSGAVQHLSGYIQNVTRELSFSVDQELGSTVVTVLDEATGDVIRQIPSEDMLKLSRGLTNAREKITKGLLFSDDV